MVKESEKLPDGEKLPERLGQIFKLLDAKRANEESMTSEEKDLFHELGSLNKALKEIGTLTPKMIAPPLNNCPVCGTKLK